MPQTKKIGKFIFKPLLDEYNKSANIVSHLDHELSTMIENSEPDTSFIEISIVLLNSYTKRYHEIESEILGHFDQYKLNLEEKMKIVTLFEEHRDSIPLVEELNNLQKNLIEGGKKLPETIKKARSICYDIHHILHKLGEKYFTNILLDNENHLTINKNSGRRHDRREMNIHAEIVADTVEESAECLIINISDGGLALISTGKFEVGVDIMIRCPIPSIPLIHGKVLRKHTLKDSQFAYALQIVNVSECLKLVNRLVTSNK